MVAGVSVGGAGDDIRRRGSRFRDAVAVHPSQGPIHRHSGRLDRRRPGQNPIPLDHFLPAAPGERGVRGGDRQLVHEQPRGGLTRVGQSGGGDCRWLSHLPHRRRNPPAVDCRIAHAVRPHLAGTIRSVQLAGLLRVRPDGGAVGSGRRAGGGRRGQNRRRSCRVGDRSVRVRLLCFGAAGLGIAAAARLHQQPPALRGTRHHLPRDSDYEPRSRRPGD